LEIIDDGAIVEVGGSRLRTLLTALALGDGRIVSAERLIDDLWESSPPSGAPNALQSLVSRLRSAVGRDFVESHPTGYRLNADIDAGEFEQRVREARQQGPAAKAAGLREALAMWRGPALADVAGAPFADAPIARLEGLRRAALQDRIDADLQLGRHTEVIPELEALTTADPLSEQLAVLLIKALYGAGRQADALEVYAATRRALDDQLGIDPSEELEQVRLAVLRHELDLPSPAAETPTNLKAHLTSFIGRDADLNRVAKLLGEGRLVTLTGPGGAGKTRLSQEAALRVQTRMPDGVWLVELAPISDPTEVPHAVLGALGLREIAVLNARDRVVVAELDPVERLCLGLHGKRMLILLDNCEHLVGAAAQLADRLLAECPEVRILATSREPLGINGETLWPVESLALPVEDADTVEAAHSPSVRLFTERAVAGRPGFALSAANVAEVVRICRALDGMPLAIELAAARLRVLSPEQIAVRLSDRFRLLTGGSRTVLPRHQTLRAVVEWSWDLLDEHERIVWRRLSVFQGGATLESAEAVCDDVDVLDGIASLVDKSLLIATDEGRYRMLETIKEYGAERLAASGEEHVTRRAHAEFFIALAEAAEPRLRSRDQLFWLDRLTADHDNIQSAVRWAISAGDGELAIRFCAGLGWYWWMRGHRAEGVEIVTAALALPGLEENEAYAAAMALGALISIGGRRDHSEVLEWTAKSQEIARRLDSQNPVLRMMGPLSELFAVDNQDAMALKALVPLFVDPDPWLRATAHMMYGGVSLNMGTIKGAEDHYQSALRLFRSQGERWGWSQTLAAYAELTAWHGDHQRAASMFEESLDLAAELGMNDDNPHWRILFANTLWLLGEYERAEALIARAVRQAERTGDIEGMASVQYQLGEFARMRGDHTEALVRLTSAAEQVALLMGGLKQFNAIIVSAIGMCHAAQGEVGAAAVRHAEALDLAVRSHDAPVIARCLVGFADLEWRTSGDAARTSEILGAAVGVRGAVDLSQQDAVALEAVVREAAGDTVVDEYFRRGRKVTGDTVQEFLTR
jgi:predicted ATPase/DNA-binding SARP family transcriptional activator